MANNGTGSGSPNESSELPEFITKSGNPTQRKRRGILSLNRFQQHHIGNSGHPHCNSGKGDISQFPVFI